MLRKPEGTAGVRTPEEGADAPKAGRDGRPPKAEKPPDCSPGLFGEMNIKKVFYV